MNASVLLAAANEAKPYERETSRSMDAKAVETLKGSGMEINDIAPEERARMRDMLKPVIEKHQQTVSADLVQELRSQLEQVRAKQ